MLIDYEYNQGNLILSYVDKKGNIKLKHYPWRKPTKFINTRDDDPDKSDKFTTWNGKAVKEVYSKYPDKYAVYDFILDLPKEEQDMIYEFNEPNIFFIDIETEILESKPIPHLAESAILSISIVNKNKALVMGVDPLSKEDITSIENDINNKYGKLLDRTWDFKYNCYKNEFDMLYNFFNVFVPNMSVMTGWNFIGFDWVYLVNRFRNIGGDPTVASFTGKLKKSFKEDDYTEMPAHRCIIDYMDLYKKDAWNSFVKIKESNALDFAAGEILGEEFGKVNYLGDLKLLYKTDKRKFMFYNVIDSILVQLIHEKTKMLDILHGLSILARSTVQHGFSTMAQVEGILREDLKKEKNIILCKVEGGEGGEDVSSEGSVSGGFVLPPVRGMASNTCCYDFASLYPTTIRQFNISADSYKGQIPYKTVGGKKVLDYDSKFSIFNGHQIELEESDIICLNGSVFKNEEGIVSRAMRTVYADRKKYKKMMMAEHIKLEDMYKLKKEWESVI